MTFEDAAWLDGLNPEQRRAATYGHDGSGPPGPLLVIAGAGSGKTATLAHRVACHIVAGADPSRARSRLRRACLPLWVALPTILRQPSMQGAVPAPSDPGLPRHHPDSLKWLVPDAASGRRPSATREAGNDGME